MGDLHEYVDRLQRQGYSEEEIQVELQNQGYRRRRINQVLSGRFSDEEEEGPGYDKLWGVQQILLSFSFAGVVVWCIVAGVRPFRALGLPMLAAVGTVLAGSMAVNFIGSGYHLWKGMWRRAAISFGSLASVVVLVGAGWLQFQQMAGTEAFWYVISESFLLQVLPVAVLVALGVSVTVALQNIFGDHSQLFALAALVVVFGLFGFQQLLIGGVAGDLPSTEDSESSLYTVPGIKSLSAAWTRSTVEGAGRSAIPPWAKIMVLAEARDGSEYMVNELQPVLTRANMTLNLDCTGNQRWSTGNRRMMGKVIAERQAMVRQLDLEKLALADAAYQLCKDKGCNQQSIYRQYRIFVDHQEQYLDVLYDLFNVQPGELPSCTVR